MHIPSFLVGFLLAALFCIIHVRKSYKAQKKYAKEVFLDTSSIKSAVIERVGDKLHILDGKTNLYMGEFTGWKDLAILLIKLDPTVTWSIKHSIPELMNDDDIKED